MKYKLLIVLLAFFALASCKKSIDTTAPDGSRIVPDGKTLVTVTLPGKTATPKTYATIPNAEDAEKSITNGVRVYIFDDNGGVPGKVIGSDEIVFGSPVTTNTEAGVQGTFLLNDVAGSFHLVAVANYKETVLPLNMTYADFQKHIVTKAPGIANDFVMTTETPVKITVTKGTPVNVTFLLQRLAARVDIINNAKTAGKVFVMQKAKLENKRASSYLMLTPTPGVPVSEFTSWTSSPDEALTAALYTYENRKVQLTAPQPGQPVEATYLQVAGTYNGVPAEFSIYFGDKPIKRNTRYLVELKSVTGDNQIQFNITVEDWSDITMNYTPDYKNIPTVASITNAGGAVVGNNNTTALNVPATETLYNFSVESPSVQSEIVATDEAGNAISWISASDLTTYANAMKQNIAVTVGKNPDATERKAVLLVRNRLHPIDDYTKKITVTQAAGTGVIAATEFPLLAKFATANVSTLNTFGPVVTESNAGTLEAMGKTYQYGRNIGFDAGVINIEQANPELRVEYNDPRIWQKGLAFTTTGNGPNWHWATTATANDTWVDVVNRTVAAAGSAVPASYIGTNGGSPCPVGWKIPMADDYYAVFPPRIYDATESFNRFIANVDRKNMSETINGKAYTADYYTTQRQVLYAIKLKGGDNAMATAYKYEYKISPVTGYSYMKVTGRLLGAKVTSTKVEDLANATFWAQNTQNDVVRIFPAGAIPLCLTNLKNLNFTIIAGEGRYMTDSHSWWQTSTVMQFQSTNVYVNPSHGVMVGDLIRCIKN